MSVYANSHHSRCISPLEKSYFRCKRNTWHVETNYILQPPKYLIIVVNRLRNIYNNFTKDRCSIPMDMTVVLGIYKFSLHATIDRHGPSMYSGHYTASISCCKNFLLQRQQNYGVWNDIPKTPPLLMWQCINWLHKNIKRHTANTIVSWPNP